MYVGRTVLVVLLCLSCCSCSSIRIWYTKQSCAKREGFTCLPTIGVKSTLIFECPSRTREYHIYINEFNGPRTVENLIIRNCEKLTILFRCTRFAWERRNMKYVEVSDIEKLRIQNVPKYQAALPPRLVLKNIKQVDNIFSNTFTQTNRRYNPARCHLPNYNFRNLYFHNISIDNIHPQAIYMPSSFGNLTFSHVRIKKLDTSSVIVNFDPTGLFLFDRSTVELIEPSSIEVTGSKVSFSKNLFLEILSNGIKVKSEEFLFSENEVASTLQSNALSVSSARVVISNNVFKFMSTSALCHIGNASELSTWYEFSGNTIEFLEEGGLLPNLNAYNISDQIQLRGNKFHCDCFLTGSLLSKIGNDTDDTATDEFYGKLFDEQSENVCVSTCNLTLGAAKGKFLHGLCTDSITVENLCQEQETTTTLVPSSPTQIVTSLSDVPATISFPSTIADTVETTLDLLTSEYNTTINSDVDNTQITSSAPARYNATEYSRTTDSPSSPSTPTVRNTVQPHREFSTSRDVPSTSRTTLYNSTNKVLTNATLLVTTVPPTKFKPGMSTHDGRHEDATTLRGPETFTSPEKSKVSSVTKTSHKKVVPSSSHTYSIYSTLILKCIIFYTIYSGY